MKKRTRRSWRLTSLLLIVALVGYGSWTLYRPLPLLQPARAVTKLRVQAAPSALSWPATGQAAAGVVGTDIIETHGPQKAAPTASTAKLITALTVLQQKPLRPGEQGPIITLSANDVALYTAYAAKDGSIVPVKVGEQISEYQTLQAILLPSSNNLADSLAVWAYGSLDTYAKAANSYITQLGLKATHVGSDASGLDPSTASTAHDLVRLGEIAMQNPVLAEIVGQSTASGIPNTETVKNVNSLLGTNGIVGIKTGNSDQAGGVFVGAARTTINGKPVTVVTAVVGAPTLFAALRTSLPLIQSSLANFQPTSVIKQGTIIGQYRLPWGGSLSARASKDLTVVAAKGSSVSATVGLEPLPPTAHAGQVAGHIAVPASTLFDSRSVSVELQHSATKPSPWWRLSHPF